MMIQKRSDQELNVLSGKQTSPARRVPANASELAGPPRHGGEGVSSILERIWRSDPYSQFHSGYLMCLNLTVIKLKIFRHTVNIISEHV